MKKRTIEEILEALKNCQPGETPIEIFELSYKIREGLELTEEEKRLKEAWLINKNIKIKL